ncbi:MAG: F0F1 ATP synthase subunit epsilon [Isosphaerales bacterium]
MSLELEILAPHRVIVHAQVAAIQAADASGRFGLRPGHERFLTVLVPCIFQYRTEDGHEWYAAVDGGVLLLEHDRVSVVTHDAVVAEKLNEVADQAAAMLEARRIREHESRSGFAGLKSSLVRELRKVEQRS